MVITLYAQYIFSFLKLRLWVRLQKSILVNSLPFTKKKKKNFRHFSWYFWEWAISLPWKRTSCYRYAIFLILLTKSMRKQNAQPAYKPIFFKWRKIADWKLWRSSANSWVLLLGLHSLKAFDRDPTSSSPNEVYSKLILKSGFRFYSH